VWNDVSHWIGKDIPTGMESCDHFMLFGELFKLKDDGKICFLVWLATTWNVWNLRNKVIFNGATPEASTLLEDIKISSWIWLSNRFSRNSCIPFSCWCIDHMSCIQST
jgi:hypothetical protein